jgi:oxaloacetate decarboxylase (Na+ extruding) subunit gamma
MLFGMSFVFIFLTLLVIATTVMSKLIIRYEKSVGVLPEDGVPSPTAVIPQHGPIAKPEVENNTLIAVFTAAIHKYRSRHK